MKEMANTKAVSVAQLNIAWLLHKSDYILPIPGTTSIKHLEENIKAAGVSLSKEEMEYLG